MTMTDQIAPRPQRFSMESWNAEEIDRLGAKADLRVSKIELLKLALTNSYQQIAALKSLPIGTVKSRINRARAELAKVQNLRSIG